MNIEVCNGYDDAIRRALAWLNQRGATLDEAYEARRGGFGMRVHGGHAGYRLEFDLANRAHLNVWAGHEKGPHYVFPGNENTVRALWRQLFFWDPKLRHRSEKDSGI